MNTTTHNNKRRPLTMARINWQEECSLFEIKVTLSTLDKRDMCDCQRYDLLCDIAQARHDLVTATLNRLAIDGEDRAVELRQRQDERADAERVVEDFYIASMDRCDHRWPKSLCCGSAQARPR